MINLNGKYTNAKIMIDDVDENCMSQIIQMINHEAFTNPVAIMPDCHSGKGSVIGFTMGVGNKLIANIIGVDISCGMLSFNVGKIKINHQDFDDKIREKIPFGINVNKKGKTRLNQKYQSLCNRVGIDFDYAVHSVGSLGSGNHFLEVGISQNTGDTWITIHSGSRNLGKKVCEYWQDIASKKDGLSKKETLRYVKGKYPKIEWEYRIKEMFAKIDSIKKSPLDYLEGNLKEGYLNDMILCQEYAKMNRQTMMIDILNILDNPVIIDMIETVHNYIDFRDNIIRKGAISSYVGERMIIPFNMRDGILICEGKSNPEWNYSAPHGAGRVYSRTKAKSDLSLEKFEKDMNGIFSTSVCNGTIDESPDAYKDSKIIEQAIEPTATILDRITPIHNMKDISEEKPWKKINQHL
jgi:tRNA-splicing ligase RtcB (3'-phosphate/5'-hydroxy nucleic acid ligase)